MSKPLTRQTRRVYVRISKETNELLTDPFTLPFKAETRLAPCNTSPAFCKGTLNPAMAKDSTLEVISKHDYSPLSMTTRVPYSVTKPMSKSPVRGAKASLTTSSTETAISRDTEFTGRSVSPLYSRKFYLLSTHYSLKKLEGTNTRK